ILVAANAVHDAKQVLIHGAGTPLFSCPIHLSLQTKWAAFATHQRPEEDPIPVMSDANRPSIHARVAAFACDLSARFRAVGTISSRDEFDYPHKMASKPTCKSDLFIFLLLLALSLPLGTACHEILGHGLVGTLVGGHVTGIEVLGFRIWPTFEHLGWDGSYGRTHWEDIPTERGVLLASLAGSMSSWSVSAIAVVLLWVRRWGRVSRLVLACLGLWWI